MNYDNIKLEKGLYTTGKTFTEALESIDPSENYIGTELEGLDAFQRQLKRFDIKVSGKNSDPIEKFFRTSDSAALFPEYISRSVAQGIESADVLSSIVATTTKIDALDYRSVTTEDTEANYAPSVVTEGSAIPETTIATKNKLVTLKKSGRMLSATYEAIRFQRLDLFTVALKQIGAAIARSQLTDAINVLLNGDGNDNEAKNVACASSALTYADLIKLWGELNPYKLTTLIASPDMMTSLLSLNEFRDSYKGLDFHASGKMITPLGAELFRNDTVPEGTVIGFDKNCALEKVEAMPVTTEFDKLIDRQLERAAITTIAGFSKIFGGSTAKLTLA
ncbi:MAG: phage major capsid protein [Acutalibacteraceae bacterium]